MANIFKIAKGIQRKHPGYTWKRCVEEAGKKMKRKTRTHAPRKKPVRKAVKHSRKKHHTAKPHTGSGLTKHSLSSLKSAARKKLNETIDHLVVRKFRAKKKTDKRKLQKQITKHNSELRKLS